MSTLRGVFLPQQPRSGDPKNSRWRGIVVPFVRESNGYFGLQSTRKVIWSSIVNILLTPIGRRIMLPEFGSELPELVHEPNDDLLQGLLKGAVADALQRWEPRVRLISTDVHSDARVAHSVYVDLVYEIIADSFIENRSLVVSRNGTFAQESL